MDERSGPLARAVVLLQFAGICLPFLNDLLKTRPLTALDLLVASRSPPSATPRYAWTVSCTATADGGQPYGAGARAPRDRRTRPWMRGLRRHAKRLGMHTVSSSRTPSLY